MPLLRAEWWEAHQPLVVFMWIILLVVPFAIVYGAGDTFEMDNDFDTLNAKFRAYGRYSFVFADWRSIFGSQGA